MRRKFESGDFKCASFVMTDKVRSKFNAFTLFPKEKRKSRIV